MIIWFFIQGDSLSVHRQTKLNFLTGNWPAVICHGYVLWKRCCSHWKQKRREERESSSKQNLIWGSFIKVFFHFIRAKEKKTQNILVIGPKGQATQYSGPDNEFKTSQAKFSLCLWCQRRCFKHPHYFPLQDVFFRSQQCDLNYSSFLITVCFNIPQRGAFNSNKPPFYYVSKMSAFYFI